MDLIGWSFGEQTWATQLRGGPLLVMRVCAVEPSPLAVWRGGAACRPQTWPPRGHGQRQASPGGRLVWPDRALRLLEKLPSPPLEDPAVAGGGQHRSQTIQIHAFCPGVVVGTSCGRITGGSVLLCVFHSASRPPGPATLWQASGCPSLSGPSDSPGWGQASSIHSSVHGRWACLRLLAAVLLFPHAPAPSGCPAHPSPPTPPRGSPGAGTGAASYLTCPQVLAPHLSWERSQQPLPGPPFSCPFLVLMRDTLSSGLLNGGVPQGFVLGHISGLQLPTLGDDPADRPPRPDAEPPCRPRAAGLQS